MMYDNFAMLTKRELLIRIVKLLKKDELITGLKYLPVEMRPRNKRPVRCCIHKDRYILKHKIISILGFEITDEEIDLIHLSDFARMAMANKNMKLLLDNLKDINIIDTITIKGMVSEKVKNKLNDLTLILK